MDPRANAHLLMGGTVAWEGVLRLVLSYWWVRPDPDMAGGGTHGVLELVLAYC